MGMTYKIPSPSKRPKKDPPARIPATIALPDGREIAVQEVVGRVTNKINYNLRQGTAYGARTRYKIAKRP
jgi:hypothetical protein